ncbi:MAG: S8 family serine peptidase, partial [Nitrospinota bacterium]|nr:S8 family serine peptidase [Nitrospinota bacterium]
MFAQSCSLDGRTEYAPPLESDLGSTIGEEKIVRISPNAQARAAAGDKVKVIVGIKTGFTPPGHLTAEAEAAQEAAIARDQDTVLNSLGGADHSHVKKYQFIPYMALSVNQNALNGLSRHPMVGSVTEDMAVQANLAQSVPLIQGDLAWNAGFTGAGQTVAILDTGVSKTHPFLSGKVVSEACYSYHDIANGYATTCPNGSQAQVGAGSGVNCNLAYGGCDHGTHVAGIAAGNGGSFSGVAKLATVIAIQVFTYDIWYGYVVAFNSDIIAGLNRAYALRGTYNISSVNLSLGGGLYSTYCDAADGGAFKAAADALSSANIATIVASGNEYSSTKISWPACVSTSISVGATSKADAVASFSNSASILKLLAPGVSINSSIPGGGYAAWGGTSMAAPHVAGAWAIYKHFNPTATVAEALAAFQANGTGIRDGRNGITKPRINILNSLRSTLNVTVSGVRGGNGTVTGTGISCPGTCTGTYAIGTSITLTAAPGGGSIFTGWGGDACSGMATTCTLSLLNRVVNVTAMFATPPVAKIDGDFDGDNKGDIFWRNYGSGVNFIWHMNGATLLGSAAVNTLHTNWLMVGVGDFDGDGNHDLLW